MELPEDLVEAIAATRVPCRWHQKGMCKKGAKCNYLHAKCEEHLTTNPFVSCTLNTEGQRQMQVRPPLNLALQKFFGCGPEELPVQSGKQVEELIVFPLQLMQERDVTACEAAKSCGWIAIGDQKLCVATNIDVPHFLMHCTSVRGECVSDLVGSGVQDNQWHLWRGRLFLPSEGWLLLERAQGLQ